MTRIIRVFLYEGDEGWLAEHIAERGFDVGVPRKMTSRVTITEIERMELMDTDGDYQGVVVEYRRKKYPPRT